MSNGAFETAVSASESGAQPVAQRIPLHAWWTLAVLLLLYIVAMMDRLILTILVDPIQRDLQIDDMQMSLILGPAFAFSNALAVFPLGWAADRWRRGRLLTGCVLLWSLATGACAMARSFPVLFFSRVGVAVGEAALLPSAYSLIGDSFPRRRLTFALAIFGMGPKLGTAAAFAIGGALLALGTRLGNVDLPLVGALRPWQFALVIVAASGALGGLLALTIREPVRTGSVATDAPKPSIAPFVQSHRALIVPLLIGFSLMGVCSGALNNWVPTYLTRAFGWTAAEYGGIMGLISLAAASSVLLKGFAVDWLFARGMRDAHLRLYTWLQIATLPVLVLAFTTSSPGLFLALFGIVNVVALSYLLYASAIVQIIAPNELRGQLSAVFLFCSSVLAQGLGPSLAAGITQYVFQDPLKLGHSLLIVGSFSMLGSIVALRYALRVLHLHLKED